MTTQSSGPQPLASDKHVAEAIAKNTVFGLLSSGAQVGTRLIMVPIVVQHLGLEGYGIWSIVMATVAYMRFGSAGIRSAFQRYVAEASVSGNFASANALLSTGTACILALSVGVLLPIALNATRLAIASGVPPAFVLPAARSITVLALTMVLANIGAAYEGAVMGRQRIDLTRSLYIANTVLEAVVMVALLYRGYGIFAMALTMAASEVVYVACCYLAAGRVAPQVVVSWRHVTRTVLRELSRYALSYQVVNVMEVLYTMLIPVVILKHFGAQTAGAFALVSRLVAVALMGQEALIVPILSGGTIIFAGGMADRTNRFIKNCFKLSVTSSLIPIGFIGWFGALLIHAWTGQPFEGFETMLRLTALMGLFQSVSRLQLILYRASGNALHDNLRQAFRLAVLLALAPLARLTGLPGLLLGLAAAELAGVLYMFFAMERVLDAFQPTELIWDAFRAALGTAIMLLGSSATTLLPLPRPGGVREVIGRLLAVCFGYAVAFWPAMTLTGAVSPDDLRSIASALRPGRPARSVAAG